MMSEAHRLLAAHTSDAASIAKAARMSNEAGLSAEHEHLRWFVYPRETAELLQKGGGGALETPLLGAIQPLDCPDAVRAVAQAGDGEVADALWMFREDEGHEGEATKGEIEEGYEEGELTDQCLVYVGEEWVEIREFLSAAVDDGVGPLVDSKKKPVRGKEDWGSVGAGSWKAVEEKKAEEEEVGGNKEVGPKEVGGNKEVGSKEVGGNKEVGSKEVLGKRPPPSPARAPAPQPPTQSKNKAKANKRPPKKLMKSIGEAVHQWDMIKDGDRLLLGLSGGKDSLTLLHCLLDIQKRAPVKFESACATVRARARARSGREEERGFDDDI
jgi:hypothetical protein